MVNHRQVHNLFSCQKSMAQDSHTHTQSSDEDFEFELRRQSVDIGVWSSLLAILGMSIYIATTWQGIDRSSMVYVALIGLLATLPMMIVPLEPILRSRWREVFFLAWSLADMILLALMIHLDGGLSSPLSGLIVLPMIFGSLTYPLPITALSGAAALGCVAGIAVAAGDPAPNAVALIVLILCAMMLTLWTSSVQTRRRNELALAFASEGAARRQIELQEVQQREAADLGRVALHEADPRTILDRATEIVSRVLNAELATVILLEEDGKTMRLGAATGIDREQLWAVTPTDINNSLAGLVITSESPVMVDQWTTESRIAPPPAVIAMNLRRSLCVPITAGGRTQGSLCCHTSRVEAFNSQDVSFMRSLCNVIGSSIERHSRENQIRHDALHDPLTGLPNRDLLMDRLTTAVQRARRGQEQLAVLFVDLDEFKLVNDSLGHKAGDQLIRSVAPRIDELLRADDTIARFGSDEFVIVLSQVQNPDEARFVSERILSSLARPFDLDGEVQRIGASIGIAIGDGTSSAEALIRDADTALRSAKAERGTAVVFDVETRAAMVERAQTEQDLRRAIDEDQLELHFQPIIGPDDDAIVAVESLVRWNHPDRGLLGPGEFIPLAERTGLINSLGRWVIDEACRQATRWLEAGPGGTPLGVSINLSAQQLTDPELPGLLEASMQRFGVPAAAIQLELTETSLMEDGERSIEMLHRLRETGVSIALDDFGTGFSSLSYIKDLPLNRIKIDRSFVSSMKSGSIEETIVKAAVDMALVLDLEVVAEGVETEQQLNRVRALGCGYVQGFYFSRPVPAAEIGVILDLQVPEPPPRHVGQHPDVADPPEHTLPVGALTDGEFRRNMPRHPGPHRDQSRFSL